MSAAQGFVNRVTGRRTGERTGAERPREREMPRWHALAREEVLDRLGATAEGLDEDEVQSRQERYGPNRLPEPPKPGALSRFFRQFHNILIYILVIAAAGTALLELWVDTAVILGVVVVNALIGFIQEGKAQHALESIRGLLAPKAVAIRSGQRRDLAAKELVPGDIVELTAGARVPADTRVLDANSLRIDEAILTGESVAVDKGTEPIDEDSELADRSSMAFSGTTITYGQGRGVVVETGTRTQVGRISEMLGEVQELTTPLLRQIARFGRWLSLAIVLLAAFAFGFGYLARGYTAVDVFLAAVSLAVAAIPQGLPAIMTVTLAIGVQRLAARNAVMRRLPAVETLGAVSVIFSDKTGTLTRNEMTVKSIVTAEREVEVSGVGYEPKGQLSAGGQDLAPAEDPVLVEALRSALLCSDAEVSQDERGAWKLAGDPTEGALVTAALKAGFDAADTRSAHPRIDAIPFDPVQKFMATLTRDEGGRAYVHVKGALETVLGFCANQRTSEGVADLDRDRWEAAMESVARRGQRVLAVAVKEASGELKSLEMDEVREAMTLLAIMGSIDPPREEAIRAVKTCGDAGIDVKMITGDHAVTAGAIAAELGIAESERVMTGRELEGLGDEPLAEAARATRVFARASPEHKLRLVEATQARRQVVAMTGDGVNDAPAVKRADVGIAMGIKGTEAAKDASEMVLADDNFASIASAVEAGRTVYDNLRKAILFILPTNGGEAFTILAAIMLGVSLPLSPLQVLWVNMVTAVTLGVSLAFEPTEPGVMRRPPRPADEPILSGFLIWRVAFVSALLVAGTFGHFLWLELRGAELAVARTAAVNTLVAAQLFYLFNSRYMRDRSLSIEGFTGSRPALVGVAVLVALQAVFVYAPPMQYLFGTAPLAVADWARVLVFGAAVFALVELEKAILRRRAAG